jgi:hypothetical protein
MSDQLSVRSYPYQFGVDARSWKPLAFWFGGGLLLVVGVWKGEWWAVAFGLVVLGLWFWLYLQTVHFLRTGIVLTGVIEETKRATLLGDVSRARARLSDGKEIVVIVPTRLTAGFLKEDGRLSVLLLKEPRSEFSIVIGARPVTGDDSGPIGEEQRP